MSDETLREALRFDKPWPVDEVLNTLAGFAEIMLYERSYDGHGHESLKAAAEHAREIQNALRAHPAPHPGTVEGRAMGVGCRTCGQAWGWRWALSDMRKGQHYYRNAKGKAFPCDGAPEPIYFAALASSGEALREAFVAGWMKGVDLEDLEGSKEYPDAAIIATETREQAQAEAERRYPRQPAPDPKEMYVCRGCGTAFKGPLGLTVEDGKDWHLVRRWGKYRRCGPVEPEARP